MLELAWDEDCEYQGIMSEKHRSINILLDNKCTYLEKFQNDRLTRHHSLVG
jgi:hypothetical protein